MNLDKPIELVCPSCGRKAGSGVAEVRTIHYLDQEWCGRCADVRTTNGYTFVAQPSPGLMIKASTFDVLDSWRDCFGEQPKRRIKKSVAKEEILRTWQMWEEDKSSVMAMLLFFGWLQQHRPYFLTFREKYDAWQTVHSWLLEAERRQKQK